MNGITLDIYGNPGTQGPSNLGAFGDKLALSDANRGTYRPVDAQGDILLEGQSEPQGWLVLPHASADGSLTAADVNTLIVQRIAAASRTRSGLRHPLNSPTAMVFAVTDMTGEVLGLYRMADAPTASLDEAMAKARNVAYYNSSQLQASDRVSNLPAGVAFSTRTVRYLSEPRYPERIDRQPPGPFSILNEASVDGTGIPQSAASFHTLQGFDSFNHQSNFHDPNNIANQNGVVF